MGMFWPVRGLDGSGRACRPAQRGKILPSTRAMTKTYPSITIITITAARPMRISTTHRRCHTRAAIVRIGANPEWLRSAIFSEGKRTMNETVYP